jgi:hypothetical protein
MASPGSGHRPRRGSQKNIEFLIGRIIFQDRLKFLSQHTRLQHVKISGRDFGAALL